ncbi:hypothetical protein HanRHA438_Chr04g0183721 [Helianthus annuus]|nr:hypothetical protein HanRHA438_Chr04g0183721 [Helianthus annuus]
MDLTETDVLIIGKVDWKGRPATKNKHGGMHAAMFVLGGFFGFLNFYVNTLHFTTLGDP